MTDHSQSLHLVKASSLKQVPMAVSEKEVGQTIIDPEMVDDYTSQAKLLQEFTNISTVSKAWMFDSNSGMSVLIIAGCLEF